jgi:hypothetical protein
MPNCTSYVTELHIKVSISPSDRMGDLIVKIDT